MKIIISQYDNRIRPDITEYDLEYTGVKIVTDDFEEIPLTDLLKFVLELRKYFIFPEDKPVEFKEWE